MAVSIFFFQLSKGGPTVSTFSLIGIYTYGALWICRSGILSFVLNRASNLSRAGVNQFRKENLPVTVPEALWKRMVYASHTWRKYTPRTRTSFFKKSVPFLLLPELNSQVFLRIFALGTPCSKPKCAERSGPPLFFSILWLSPQSPCRPQVFHWAWHHSHHTRETGHIRMVIEENASSSVIPIYMLASSMWQQF